MKKLLSILVLSLLFSGNAYAEILYLSCKNVDSSNEATEWRFDLKNKIYTTVFGTQVDITHTEEGIFFHTYLKEAVVTTFHVNRLNGKATIKMFNYDDAFKMKVREKLTDETNKIKSKYPKYTENELFILALHNITLNYPGKISRMNCSKLTQKF